MLHDLSPFAIRISGDFGIRWYGLSYMMGFFVAYVLIFWLVRKQRTGITQDQVSDLITFGAIGTLVGGRLGYCLFYSPDLFTKFKSTFPYWGVLAVNEGGMASHGGIIGIIIGAVWFAKKYKLNSLYALDLVAVAGPIGVMFGRIANFINGELVGRVAPESFAYAVKFPSDIYLWPKNSYEKLKSLSETVRHIGVSDSSWNEILLKSQTDPGAKAQLYDILARVIDATQNGNEALKVSIAKVLEGRYPSQLFAAFGEGLFIFLCLFLLWKNPRRPGTIASVFVMLYAVVRIADEFFRLPDDHIGFEWLGLTRGQWLSVVMFLFGMTMKFVWSRTEGQIINGWSPGKSIKLNRK